MLINLTNHPSTQWSAEQQEAAKAFGVIVDLPFPNVDPDGDESYISDLADDYLSRILALADGKPVTVHLMGEMNFTAALLQRLHQQRISCVAATTQRIVKELPDGTKNATFQFVQFRKYE